MKNAIVRLTIENFAFRDMVMVLEQQVKELENKDKDVIEEDS